VRILKILMLFLCVGCGATKDALNLNKNTPDEFQVVTHRPLNVPPSFALVAPEPGAPRPQEVSATDMARQSLYAGVVDQRLAPDSLAFASAGEHILLDRTGGARATNAIRTAVNAETVKQDDVPLAKILDKKTAASVTVVDSAAEAERIKNAKDAGETLDGDETATTTQKNRFWDWLF
jgi:Protein of unknown function (DUF3035)